MNLSLQQCQRQEIRQKQIMMCGVCKREAKHIDWNLLDADQPASHMEAVIWYRDNQPTGLEWFLWKVANGRCPNCTQVLCDGQVPDKYIKRWLKIYKSTKEVSDAPD
jgi:hypothetical protein